MATWEIETGGTLGEGGEHTPVNYPRPDALRSAAGDVDPAANGGADEELGDHPSDTSY